MAVVDLVLRVTDVARAQHSDGFPSALSSTFSASGLSQSADVMRSGDFGRGRQRRPSAGAGKLPLRFKAAGKNDVGQCGLDPEQSAYTLLTATDAFGLRPPSGSDVLKVCCGYNFVMVLTRQHEVLHVGDNTDGQRGIGHAHDKPSPVLHTVEIDGRAVDLAVGSAHIVTLLDDGAVYTWGCNHCGQCGRASRSMDMAPSGEDGRLRCPGPVERVNDVKEVIAGGSSTFLICHGKQVLAFGRNDDGQLALGRAGDDEQRPQRVSALCGHAVHQLRVSECVGIAVVDDGVVLVWGKLGAAGFDSGRLADGSGDWTVAKGSVPVRVAVAQAQCVAAGEEHLGVVGTDGVLKMWGKGFAAQPTTVPLPGGRRACAVVCGAFTTFARAADGPWSGCGQGDKGLPFAHSRDVTALREFTPECGLATACEVLCGSTSIFALYLSGYEARNVTEETLGISLAMVTVEESAAVAGALACAALCDAEVLLDTSRRYLGGLKICRALRGLASFTDLLLRPGASEAPTAAHRSHSPGHGMDMSSMMMISSAEYEPPPGQLEGGAAQRQQSALVAQMAREASALAEFSERAEDDAVQMYPDCRDPVIRAHTFVASTDREIGDSPKIPISSVPELERGEVGQCMTDPVRKEVRLMLSDWDGPAVLVPQEHLVRVHPPRMLQWLREFPGRWKEGVDSSEYFFRNEDVVCPPSWTHRSRRPAGKASHCCLMRSLRTVLKRMLDELGSGGAQWERAAQGFINSGLDGGAEEFQEGIAAAHIFCTEIYSHRYKRPRATQVHKALDAAMRRNWDEQLDNKTEAANRLRLFAPLIYHLCNFTRGMAQQVEHVIVFRGINSIVAQGYQAGSDFVWGCFSSSAENPDAVESFGHGVGTLFVLRERSATPIAMCSLFPGAAERILPPAQFTVLARMPETTLCVAETRSDIVIAEEQPGPDVQLGDEIEEARAGVRLRLRAHRCSAFIFKMFAGRFVEPRLVIDDDQVEVRLFEHFDGFQGQGQRVTLLRGDGGTGKTSVMLALLEHMLRKPRAADMPEPETPIFVHCPWAEGLLTEAEPVLTPLSDRDPETMVGPIVRAFCAGLAVSTRAELEELKRQEIIILLDSLDECPISGEFGPGELLQDVPLLPRGGVTPEDWPNARFIICCRKEYLDSHYIRPQMLDPDEVSVCDIQPFTTEEQHQYVSKLAKQEVEILAERLGAADPRTTAESAIEWALGLMRCVPCSQGAAAAICSAQRRIVQAVHSLNAAFFSRAHAQSAEQEARGSLKEAKTTAIAQCESGVRKVLQSLPADLIRNPFVLFLSCSASRELSCTPLTAAPRYRVYAAWMRLDGAERISRAPELGEVMPETADRADRLMDAVSTLAVGMYAQKLWQAEVGACVQLLGGGPRARAVLSVLPLRMESAHRDTCRVTWRHRTLQEFAIARALLLPRRTLASTWEAALSGPLASSPEAEAFFAEGWLTLTDDEQKVLLASLGMASAVPNAAVLLAATQAHQQQQRGSDVSLLDPLDLDVASPSGLKAELAMLRHRVRLNANLLAEKDSTIMQQAADLDRFRRGSPRGQGRPPQPTTGIRSAGRRPPPGVTSPKSPRGTGRPGRLSGGPDWGWRDLDRFDRDDRRDRPRR